MQIVPVGLLKSLLLATLHKIYSISHILLLRWACPSQFARPFKLQMDNSAAQTFAEGSAFKSKMKHIDFRQEWVKVLRDREICTPVHVDTKDNLADIFTKILPEKDFTRLRNRLMYNMNQS